MAKSTIQCKSHEEYRAETKVVLEPAKRFVAHEQDRERIDLIAAFEKISDRAFVDKGSLRTEFPALLRHQSFGMSQRRGIIVFIQQGKWTRAGTDLSISNHFSVALIHNALACGRDPAMDIAARMTDDHLVDSIDILQMKTDLHWLDDEIRFHIHFFGFAIKIFDREARIHPHA